MTLFEALEIAEKFNNTIFTNTPEMVNALGVLIQFADQYSYLAVRDNGTEIDY